MRCTFFSHWKDGGDCVVQMMKGRSLNFHVGILRYVLQTNADLTFITKLSIVVDSCWGGGGMP